jgi:hypothetical protein
MKSNKVQSLFLKYNFNFNFKMRSMSWLSQNAHILLNENSYKQSLFHAQAFSPKGEFHQRILQKNMRILCVIYREVFEFLTSLLIS